MHSSKIPPVLQKIVDVKQKEILKIPKNLTYSMCKISFKSFLQNSEKNSIIAECKKGSPSEGIIRTVYEPVQIAKIYESFGSSAISVLTDSTFFYGSLEDLKNVSSSVGIPVLRKDFILSEKQIIESRHYGASAILLIVRILEENQLLEYLSASREMGMDVLVETHNQYEIDLALKVGSDIIGINTRDLDTFEIHTDLVSKLHSIIPCGCISVGESGIKTRTDFLEMKKYMDSVLIGTYFMKSKDIQSDYLKLIRGGIV